jgi:hypothetical protein
MQNFDPSCGLSRKEIEIIKYCVKHEIGRKLPLLPDSVETKLFLQGRNAWTFSWFLLHEKFPISSKEPVSLEVIAKLKRDFHCYQDKQHYKFSCEVKIVHDDLYNPKLTIKSLPDTKRKK